MWGPNAEKKNMKEEIASSSHLLTKSSRKVLMEKTEWKKSMAPKAKDHFKFRARSIIQEGE